MAAVATELWEEVFTHLDLDALHAVRSTCRAWQQQVTGSRRTPLAALHALARARDAAAQHPERAERAAAEALATFLGGHGTRGAARSASFTWRVATDWFLARRAAQRPLGSFLQVLPAALAAAHCRVSPAFAAVSQVLAAAAQASAEAQSDAVGNAFGHTDRGIDETWAAEQPHLWARSSQVQCGAAYLLANFTSDAVLTSFCRGAYATARQRARQVLAAAGPAWPMPIEHIALPQAWLSAAGPAATARGGRLAGSGNVDALLQNRIITSICSFRGKNECG